MSLDAAFLLPSPTILVLQKIRFILINYIFGMSVCINYIFGMSVCIKNVKRLKWLGPICQELYKKEQLQGTGSLNNDIFLSKSSIQSSWNVMIFTAWYINTIYNGCSIDWIIREFLFIKHYGLVQIILIFQYRGKPRFFRNIVCSIQRGEEGTPHPFLWVICGNEEI